MDEDLTTEQLKVLEMVSREQHTVYDLNKEGHIPLATASLALDTLRKRDLVREEKKSRDKRIHSLTPKGRAVLNKLPVLTRRTREIIHDTLPKVAVKRGVKRIGITYDELASQLNSSRNIAKFCAGKVLNKNLNGIPIVLDEGPIKLIIKDDPIEDQGDNTFHSVPAKDTSDERDIYSGPTRTQEETLRKGDEKHHSGGGGSLIPFAVGAGLAGLGLVVWRLHRWYSSR